MFAVLKFLSCGGWDMHNSIYAGGTLPNRAGYSIAGLGNLLKDLSARGLLDETLVVLATEFGSITVINYNAGRDHHPAAFFRLHKWLERIQGGPFLWEARMLLGTHVYQMGSHPLTSMRPLRRRLGLPLDQEIISGTGRPSSSPRRQADCKTIVEQLSSGCMLHNR